jgi:ribosomal protein L37AE/L43A
MGLFWRVSASDRDHAIVAIRSLHTSSVAGVAAALSWSQRRTQRVLNEVAARNPNRIAFDRSAGQVRWLDPAPPPAPNPPTPPPREARPAPAMVAPPVPEAPLKWGSGYRCPSCHVPMTPSGTPGLWVCAQCGKLSGSPGSSAGPPSPSPSSVAAPPPPTAPSAFTDRRSQEMLAAWVTSQPIPCPKCRQPLRHRGVGEYACPACGQQIRFPREGALSSVSPPPPAS